MTYLCHILCDILCGILCDMYVQPSLQPYASQVGREAVAVEVAERGAKVVAVGEVCVGIRAIDCTLTMAISSLPTLLAMAITSMALYLP